LEQLHDDRRLLSIACAVITNYTLIEGYRRESGGIHEYRHFLKCFDQVTVTVPNGK